MWRIRIRIVYMLYDRPDIYYIHFLPCSIYIHIYYSSAIFCVLQSYLTVIAILYSDFYPIYYSNSVPLSLPPTTLYRCRLLFRKGFPKSPRDTCPTFLSAALEPADEIYYSGRSITVVEFNLNWRFPSTSVRYMFE